MVSVPRVLNRIYAAVKAQTIDAPGVRGAIARKAFASKLEYVKRTGNVEHPLWDRVIWNKVRQVLGGRVRYCGVGSAPIAGEVVDFLRVAFCMTIIEGCVRRCVGPRIGLTLIPSRQLWPD
jgi:long-chain acyl-CoA synthetase